jgi:hypothetical protein
MNRILQEQNTARSINLQAAKSYFYTVAERTQTVQLVILVANALFWPLFLAVKPEMKVWSALAALLIPMLEVALIEPLQKRWKTCGAKMQEVFDCMVLQLGWNDFKVGEVPREEYVVAGANKFRLAKRDESKLNDWYTFDFSDLPTVHARLVCQRANAWWDSELRGVYMSLIRWSVGGLALLALIIGIAAGLTVERLILAVVAPLTPICMWGLRETRKQSSIILDGERLVKRVDSLWRLACEWSITDQELEAESRSLQNEIYDRRRSSAVNPQWLYWRKRDEFQTLMVESANQRLAEYRQALLEKP